MDDVLPVERLSDDYFTECGENDERAAERDPSEHKTRVKCSAPL